MIRSKIIIGHPKKTNQRAWEIAKNFLPDLSLSYPDLFFVKGEENSIQIETIREIKKWLTLKPYFGKGKVVIIQNGEKLTLPAQNALLKTLEEPPSNTLIIITTQMPELILPTILSRCQIIRISQEKEIIFSENLFPQIINIRKMRVGERLKMGESYAQKKENAELFLTQLLFYFKNLLLTNPSLILARNINLTLKTIKLIKQNVNPLLATGNLLIRLI
ncbi:MAG: hypothetical protein ACPLKP_00340 [Microgenomates group bacterium]